VTIADGMMADGELARARVVDSLARGGFVSPDAEADVLIAAAGEGVGPLDELVRRRLGGEPLAWITGSVRFCGISIRVRPGVFVPRPHTETLAIRASVLVPDDGVCVDLCTGSGAVAVVVMAAHNAANVVGTDIDPVAVACARENGVDARLGDLDEPLPHSLHGRVDVMTAVVPYVPTEALHLLPRDVLAYEPRRALDGGDGGTVMLVRAAEGAARLVRPGGSVLLELGGTQANLVSARLRALGFEAIGVHRDDDGFDRALEARKVSTSSVEGRER
jgi:release factor glutamine methyltransferase